MGEGSRSLRILSAGHEPNGTAERRRKIRLETWTVLEKTKKAISKAGKRSAEEK